MVNINIHITFKSVFDVIILAFKYASVVAGAFQTVSRKRPGKLF